MTTITVTNGLHGKTKVENVEFQMIREPKVGVKGLFVTVDGSPMGFDRNIRIQINSMDSITFGKKDVVEETDYQIIERMREKFSILGDMSYAAVSGVVRGMIITGPPGIGKSYGVVRIVEEAAIMAKIAPGSAKLGVEKGAASPIGLYQMLHEYSAKGSMLVLDDSDTILYDETSLNLLKAALDSGKTRRLSWRSESRVLDAKGIPDRFKFEGSIIFITNLNFMKARGKIGTHLEAIMSRCHYIDMGISTMREKLLRCQQIVADGMLNSYHFTGMQESEVLQYIDVNQNNLLELSLRMVIKIADLAKMDPNNWQRLANATCLKS